MKQCLISILVALATGTACAANDRAWLAPYNIVWTNASTRAVDSMPLGGGNISLNVWTTESELLFYIGSSDSWVDGAVPGHVQQTKLGRVRLTLSPNPFAANLRQELDLASNSIRVSGTAPDGTAVKLRLWVDAFKPIVHVEGEASKPVSATAAVEIWRGEGRLDDATVVWHYRNEGPSRARSKSIVKQKIESFADAVPDPVKNLTFGGRLSCAGWVSDGDGKGIHEGCTFSAWRLKTVAPVTSFDLRATLRIEQDPTVEAWEKGVAGLEAETRATAGQDWTNTAAWWRSFWDRSRIVINPGKSVTDPAWEVGRNYQLFRAMLAANRSGRMPTLFSGGAFLCEAKPDSRQWGTAGFTAQNQRLVYWPLLKSGDDDLLRVALDFYAARLPLERAWAKHFWNIDGSVFPESIDLFGMPVRMAREDGTDSPACLQYHWTSGMEFALMMLETGCYTGADIRRYVPVANGILRFYDQFYRQQCKKGTGQELDKNGRLVIFPGSGLENYAGARNDSAALSGLMALSDALLALPEQAAGAADRAFWQAFRDRLPPLTTRTWNKHLCLSPAESWQSERLTFNMELPQLYPVFPFGQYGIGRPGLELARDTWRYGYTDAAKQKAHFCWYQGGIFAARLGLTDEAREYALARFLHPRWPEPGVKNGDPDRYKLCPWKLRWKEPGWQVPRYPAFWDSMIFDQRPDMDHGGAGMIQLQEMLMQTPGRKIVLLPAWPREWDCEFKLHAPYQTVVEGRVVGGKIANLKVTPESRRQDVEITGHENDDADGGRNAACSVR